MYGYGQDRKKGRHNASAVMDAVHIVIGSLIVLLAVITFLNPDGNQVLLPVIFALAAALNVVNGFHKFRISGRSARRKAVAAAQLLLALFLIVVATVSAISIWR